MSMTMHEYEQWSVRMKQEKEMNESKASIGTAYVEKTKQDPPHTTPLYTEPREWVELTDDEARALVNRATFGDKTNWQALVYMVDAKLKEKNA